MPKTFLRMANGWKMILIACLAGASVHQSWAAIACPVYLVEGKADQNGIVLSFRNKGKLPIQELAFNCTPASNSAAHRVACHTETGLFFPGTDYTSSFAYSNRAKSIQLSLRSARLSDGSSWLLNRDQRCHPLRIDRKRKP
jgi:hypothetical protein